MIGLKQNKILSTFSCNEHLYQILTKSSIVLLIPTNTISYITYLPHYNIVLTTDMQTDKERKFFKLFSYKTVAAPYLFSGGRDLKHVRDNLYIGGYGNKSNIETFHWIEDNYDCKIVSVKIESEYLSDLILPLNKEKALVNIKFLNRYDTKSIEKYIDVIPVKEGYYNSGWTNSFIMTDQILHKPQSLSFLRLMRRQGLNPIEINMRENISDIILNLSKGI